MEKKLSPQQEKVVSNFKEKLDSVQSVDDMFPPDDISGVHEPRRPLCPTLASAAVNEFAPVYDLSAYRNRRFVSYGGLFPDAA